MRVEVPTVGFYGIASATQRVSIGPLGADCLVGLRASAGVSTIIHMYKVAILCC
jgi:hypothetical protein